MTDEQRYVFDLKGYLLIPDVLNTEEVAALKTQIQTIREDPESLPPHERGMPGGASSLLIDHPVVMDILSEILGEVRMESSWFTHREKGQGGPPPHGGTRNVNPTFNYQCMNGKIYSALTRVVFELNEVRQGEGGTQVVPGSHKANFSPPENLNDFDSGVWETYSCPPGSMMLFTENLRHAGDVWKNADWPRLAVFNCYNYVGAQFHHPTVPQHIVDGLPPEKKAFFRDVWVWNSAGPDNGKNLRYLDA